MPSRDFARPTGPRRALHLAHKGRAPQAPPAVAAPHHAPLFTNPVSRVDAPITRAQTRATRRATTARKKVNRRTVAPAVPKLAHPTSTQRAAAKDLVVRSLRSQGLTPADVRAMPKVQRQRINRGLGYGKTLQRNVDIRVALAERVRQAQTVPLPEGFRYGSVSGSTVVEKRTKNPYTGQVEWLPADSFVGKGTEDRVVARGGREQRAAVRAGERSVRERFNADVERIVSKVPPAQQRAALRRLVKQYTPAPGKAPKHPRMALAQEGARLGRSRQSEGKPYAGDHLKVLGLDLDFTDLTHGGRALLNKATAGLDPIPAAVLKDALTFPVGAVQAGAAIARASRDALGPLGFLTPLAPLVAGDYLLRPGAGTGGGNFKQATALADAFTRGPLGELVIHGDPEAALKSLREHPLYGAFDLAAGYGAAGRLAGGAGRLGLTAGLTRESSLGRVAHALGDTSRESARLYPGAAQEVSRSYSKNALTKALQVRSDRRTGNVIPQKGPIADRLSGRTKALRGAVHEFASTEGEGVRRRGQSQVAHDLVELVGTTAAGRVTKAVGKAGSALAAAVLRRHKTGDAGPVVDEAFRLDGKKLGRAARDTLAAMVEGRVELHPDMTPAELRAAIMREHDRLAQANEVGRSSWSREEVRLNRLQRRALLHAAGDEKLLGNAPRLAHVRDRIVEMSDTIEEGLIRAGVLDRRQALIAKVRPLAVARLGHRPMSPADRSRLEAERRTRVETYVRLRHEHDEASAADVTARRVEKLLGLYRLQKDAGATKGERAAARKKYHELRADMEFSAAQVARIDKVHTPEASAAARAVRDRTEAALAHHKAALPAHEVNHAEAVHRLAAAERAVKAAQKRVERAQLKRSEAIGGERRARGQAQHAGEDLPKRSASRKEAERRLESAKAALLDAKKARKDARDHASRRALPDYSMGLIDRHGVPVTTDDVVAQMEREGIPMPGYVRHARGREAASFFRNWFRPGRRSRLSQGSRTGTATERGGYASDWHALAESMMRRRGDLDSVQTWDRFVHQFGVTKPGGQMFTPDEVEPFLRHMGFLDFEGKPQPNMPELVAVWAYPKGAPRELIEASQQARNLRDTVLGRVPNKVEGVVEHDVLGPAVDLRHGGALEELLNGPADPNRRLVLMPAEQLRAFRDHQQTGTTTAGKLGNAVTNTFRGTVLPFSSKWLTGNVLEAFLRLAVSGARADDLWRGHRILKELRRQDEQAYEMLRTRALGGLFYGSAERLRVHSGASRFEHTSLESVAGQLERMGETQPFRAALGGLHSLQHGIFRLNRWFETESQITALGRYGRERGQEFSKSWFKATAMQGKVLEQVAKGLIETPEQIRFARYVDETLGKYARFSPQTRRIIQTVAPFLPWYLNSVRFILHTLPAKHPVLTSLIARTEAVMQPDMEKLRGDVPPGDLEAAIPEGDNKYLTLARYTPFGAFTSGLDVVTDPILPQMITSFGILKYGVNFTGRELDIGDPDHKGRNIPGGKRALMALSSQLEGLLPFMQIARRLQEHGETAYDDSYLWAPHTKPDTAIGGNNVGDALTRIFNPFRPVVLRPQQSGASSSAAALKALPAGERKAIEQEARGLVQESTASDAEQRAIEDEARRILAAQGAG